MPDWFPSTLAETIVFVPLRIAFLIIAAALTRWIVHRLIRRTVRRTIEQPPHRSKAAQALAQVIPRVRLENGDIPQSNSRREQRIAALGSLARSVVTVVIMVVTAMMILAELGFNITTILAGSSIVAVTIAFGLQNVVKDLVSGVFILVEDQLGVGDWVDLEKASGTVEEVGLRVTQLRALDGTAWYVRNGEVVRVGNFSQGGPGRPSDDAGGAASP